MQRVSSVSAFDGGAVDTSVADPSAFDASIVDAGDVAIAPAPEQDCRYLVDCIDGVEHFDAFRRPLEELARSTLEPALGAEFAWSKAALAHLAGEADSGSVALIWRYRAGEPGDPLRLVGAFAMQIEHPLPGFSPRRVKSWTHLFSFSGVPLIHRDHAGDVLDTLFKWAFGPDVNASGILLEKIPVEGPFAMALARAVDVAGLRLCHMDRHERAVLAVPESLDDYLNSTLPRKKRKEFRRLRSRLAEQGDLQVHELAPGDDVARWLTDFYALEGRGWKGRAQTSLSCDPAWTGYFDVAFKELHGNGDALFWKLTLDGAPVAMTLGARSGRQAWLFKIAHDEDHARHSPGVLIVLDAMAALAERGEIDMIDSCAQADHPMINHLWRERLELHDVVIGRPGQSRAVFAAFQRLTRLRRDGRALAKRLYKTYLNGGAK